MRGPILPIQLTLLPKTAFFQNHQSDNDEHMKGTNEKQERSSRTEIKLMGARTGNQNNFRHSQGLGLRLEEAGGSHLLALDGGPSEIDYGHSVDPSPVALIQKS